MTYKFKFIDFIEIIKKTNIDKYNREDDLYKNLKILLLASFFLTIFEMRA